MRVQGPALHIARILDDVANSDDLAAILGDLASELGFDYFALSHHGGIAAPDEGTIRLHNYPDRWADYYERRSLGASDPVHRASQSTAMGFRWDDIPAMIALTERDRAILERGRSEGIGNDFTVPAHVPGEACGSCTFARPASGPIPDGVLPAAQLAGTFAFEAARRLSSDGSNLSSEAPRLTDRQRDCVLWAARGKGDWEIGRILGISEETAGCHIKHACDRYGVSKRTSLAIRTLFDGTITFADVYRH